MPNLKISYDERGQQTIIMERPAKIRRNVAVRLTNRFAGAARAIRSINTLSRLFSF